MKLFVNGRKNVFKKIQQKLPPKTNQRVWVHAASLGEYEQAVPILQGLLELNPECEIILSFFSPSGYEVKKNSEYASSVTYLPLDTPNNAKKFIQEIKPDMALFIKYEIWPHYLKELESKGIPTFLISANFRENQFLFHPLGKFMFKALQSFTHIFVQHQDSLSLLQEKGIFTASVSGDTRYDRVFQQLQMENYFAFAEEFKQQKLCMVCGSTWPEDEDLLLEVINKNPDLKLIIAPHEVGEKRVQALTQKLDTSYILHSQLTDANLRDSQVLIIDNIGLLSQLYAYADLAYVGGAAGNTGLHNILEPATFGVPILIGENHSKFPEAELLLNENALFSVASKEELNNIVTKLITNASFRKQTGQNSFSFIQKNKGAKKIILDVIRDKMIR
ncbi:3-deoxy-D-manno-octulosonic acid transferase [Mesonia ostreae]|uniref:3-deoxy-D-manno-octulosonic acid transferase n=1 Tax=Mesonia ostreae TaxID=861110 RepID=A0ABU2KM52_9FLAO|nr:glycosyltransferase N-terminal domain-containing protein [Mesonia ostreae]MDT0295802.1 glycosyltransferase N-terminal domain-containing protein [Mesonia ostreae]